MNIDKAEKLKIVNRFAKKKCFKKAIEYAAKYKIKGVMITRKSVKEKHQLTDIEIKKLSKIEVDNPHYKCAGKMRLYLIAQVEHVARIKHHSSIDSINQ